MRLTSFLVISVALHAAALTCPVAFPSSRTEELISVVVWSSGDASDGGVRVGGSEGKRGEPAAPKRRAPARSAKLQETKEKEESTESIEPVSTIPSATVGPAGIEVGPGAAASTGTAENLSGPSDNGGAEFAGAGNNGAGGAGRGSGIGHGDGGGAAKFVQVSYAYSPRPQYPDSARREGKEGRVLLRVLVDEEGRSKSVEVNQSSGSVALDRAATEAIKYWRFLPARKGDKPVESWVKVPIDFRLTDR